ncbi:hypothetical protein, partial [Cupriavidus plantarum]|uniref:hypothetical protein n=1 Tax=Cupriavidus plantarum TaxID=942865 RepID=UPI001AC007CB
LSVRRHQAPTLIGCLFVKELAHPALPPAFLLLRRCVFRCSEEARVCSVSCFASTGLSIYFFNRPTC